MLNYNRSSNPYFSGVKPRTFFQKRNELLKKEKMTSSGRRYNPNWISEIQNT